jgi:cell division transport system permease protein
MALTGILLLAQLFIVMTIGARGVESLIRSRMDIQLEIADNATDARIQALFAELQSLPQIEDVEYITREKAYELERARDPELIDALERFNLRNPFPETFRITLRSLNDYGTFSTFVNNARWNDVVNADFLSQATDQEQRIQELLRLTQAGRFLVLSFLGLTGIVLLLILMELVRRRSLMRSEEILIERLFGASDLSVLLPFATESAVLLLGALVFSACLIVAFLILVPFFSSAFHSDGILGSLSATIGPLLFTFLPVALLLQLICAPLLALLGAWLGMRPQLLSRKLIVTGV